LLGERADALVKVSRRGGGHGLFMAFTLGNQDACPDYKSEL